MLTKPALSRPTLFLWLKIRIEGETNFRLSFPVPIYTLFLLTDIMGDAAAIWKIFHRQSHDDLSKFKLSRQGFKEQLKKPTPETLSIAANAIRMLLRSLIIHTGVVNLVDIELDTDDERISVTCGLR